MIRREALSLTDYVSVIDFDVAALLPLQRLYWEIYAGEVAEDIEIGLKLHDEEPSFEEVKMRWFFANSERAISLFRAVLDNTNLRTVRSMFGSCEDNVRVVQGNLIEIRGGYPQGKWHSDFTEEGFGPLLSATLLTPLFPFKPHFGGLEITKAKREDVSSYEQSSFVYRYRDGQAIVFDGSASIHRTQSYFAEVTERRVLVSWQLADVNPSIVPALTRIGKKNGDPMFFSRHELVS